MDERRRLHREDPKRTGPIRTWSTLYRRPDSWGARDPSAGQPSADEATRHGSENKVVEHGVKLGYRVIEEYIRQGQRIAQQINTQAYSPERLGNDVRKLTERIFRSSADLLSLWVELVNSIAGNPDLLRNWSRMWQPQAESPLHATTATGASPNGGPTTRGTAVSIEILSTRPTQVMLDLQPQSAELSLMTHGLRAVDAAKPPLTDITFTPGLGGVPARVRICVPEGQPPDLYTGVVIDRATGLPRGTLSVRLTA